LEAKEEEEVEVVEEEEDRDNGQVVHKELELGPPKQKVKSD